jgi:E-phenylitaconyl-CoA hydratase
MLTADTIDAAKAERWGLINQIVPSAELLSTAYAMARKIAGNAPLAVQAAKELAVRSRDMDLASGLRMEQIANRMLWESEDIKEGTAAFAEKRAPRFQGR